MEHIESSRMDHNNAGEQFSGKLELDLQAISNMPSHAYVDGQPCCCPCCFFDL